MVPEFDWEKTRVGSMPANGYPRMSERFNIINKHWYFCRKRIISWSHFSVHSEQIPSKIIFRFYNNLLKIKYIILWDFWGIMLTVYCFHCTVIINFQENKNPYWLLKKPYNLSGWAISEEHQIIFSICIFYAI